MISRSEAMARKGELEAAFAWTPAERRELGGARSARDDARTAYDQALGRFLAARQERKPSRDIDALELALNEAAEISDAANQHLALVENRLEAARQGRRRAVKGRHQVDDDARTNAAALRRPRQRVRVFDGNQTTEYVEGARR